MKTYALIATLLVAIAFVQANGNYGRSVEKEQPDCNYFLNECSELCNNDVLIAQCWGDPLYAYCKARDGEVFHIHGFSCEHSTCPPDALDLGCEEGWIHGKDSEDLEKYCYKVLGAEVRDDPQYISFDQCQQDCNKLGGKLASIHSEAENTLIWQNLGNIYHGPPFRKTDYVDYLQKPS